MYKDEQTVVLDSVASQCIDHQIGELVDAQHNAGVVFFLDVVSRALKLPKNFSEAKTYARYISGITITRPEQDHLAVV